MNEVRINDDLRREIIVRSTHRLFELQLKDLWHFRELIYFLSWRDIKIRYKQTALGILWAVLQPFLTMLIFSIIFGRLARLPSADVPYPIFTFTALIPWQLFSYSLTQSSMSLISDQNLITKIFFPRLVIPISSVVAGLLDSLIGFCILIMMIIYFHIQITWRLFTIPIFIIMTIVSALAIGFWLSALNVKYRDVRYTLPFLTQIWMFSTPIAYSIEIIPEKWRWFYSMNPMTGVVNGFRWALLNTPEFSPTQLIISGVVMLFLFVGGVIYFKKMEENFADII